MKKNPDQVFDELLVLRYKSGDKQAMDLLVKRWHKRILMQVIRTTYEPEVAEDIGQEIWEAILKGIYNLKEPALFGIWALRIATRKAVDHIRKNSRERKIQEELMIDQVEPTETTNDPARQVMTALKSLPKQQKTILSMFYLEKQTILEIATILEIPPGTVKSRLYHAREYLKKKIKEYDYENQGK